MILKRCGEHVTGYGGYHVHGVVIGIVHHMHAQCRMATHMPFLRMMHVYGTSTAVLGESCVCQRLATNYPDLPGLDLWHCYSQSQRPLKRIGPISFGGQRPTLASP